MLQINAGNQVKICTMENYTAHFDIIMAKLFITFYCLAWHGRGSHLTKISISIYEGIIKKISYELQDYETVDEMSLSTLDSMLKNDAK